VKAALVTKSEIAAKSDLMTTIAQGLLAHIQASYATAHHALSSEVGTYQDSHGDTIGTRILAVPIDGVTYYIPCRLVIGDAPTT
jgi:hypothetical protein